MKSEFMTRDGKYRALYPLFSAGGRTQYRMESALRMDAGACVSSLLAQYQISLFLGMRNYTPGFSQTASIAL